MLNNSYNNSYNNNICGNIFTIHILYYYTINYNICIVYNRVHYIIYIIYIVIY